MTNNQLDLIESLMGGHKGTAAAQAARAVLVDGVRITDAQATYNITRSAINQAIAARRQVLATAKKIVELEMSA